MPVLRSNAKGLPVEYVELHYQDRAIPVAYRSAPRSLEITPRKNGTALVIPFVDDQAFNDFYRFLASGAYAPPMGKGGGPPRLGQDIGIAEPLCLTDIRAYRLGASLGVPELQEYALERLWSHAVTFEDPVAALDHLYHGPAQPQTCDGRDGSESKQSSKESSKDKASGSDKAQNSDKADGKGCKDKEPRPPDEALRAWARAWFRVPNSDGRRNIDILRYHASWSCAWKALKAKGGPLIVDVDAVEDEIPRVKSQERLAPQRPCVRVELQSPEMQARGTRWTPEELTTVPMAPGTFRLERGPTGRVEDPRVVQRAPEILGSSVHRNGPLAICEVLPEGLRVGGRGLERRYPGPPGNGRFWVTDYM